MTNFFMALLLALGAASMIAHAIQFVNFLSTTVELRGALRDLEESDMWVETHVYYGDHIYYIKKGAR